MSTLTASLHLDENKDAKIACNKVWDLDEIPDDNTYALHLDDLTIFIYPEQLARLRAVCGDALLKHAEQNKMFNPENVG